MDVENFLEPSNADSNLALFDNTPKNVCKLQFKHNARDFTINSCTNNNISSKCNHLHYS